jgi:hypothetical protein
VVWRKGKCLTARRIVGQGAESLRVRHCKGLPCRMLYGPGRLFISMLSIDAVVIERLALLWSKVVVV